MTTETVSSLPRSTPKPGTSIAELFPDLVSRWDTETNAPLTPADVSRASSVVVSWKCLSGHKPFTARVGSMTRQGPGGGPVNGCPECAAATRRAPKAGRKSLAEEFPEVAAQWDYEANYPLTPEQVAPRSNQKAWFACPVHGSALCHISNRTAGHGCSPCRNAEAGQASREAAVKRGSLAAVCPDLAVEWNIELNTRTAWQVSPGSADFAWWNCPKGHAPYRARIGHKKGGRGCPACGQLRRLSHLKTYEGPKAGHSLADLRPEIAALWDAERNERSAYEVAPYSHTVANWTCAAGHSFEKRISQMLTTNCPVCRPRKKAVRRGQ